MQTPENKQSDVSRCRWHDYRVRGIYMLTMVVRERMPLFGRLVGDVNAKRWSENAPRIDFSPLGAAVMHEELKKISQFYPMVEVWRVSIMPDHIHLIVSVKEDMGEGKHLGVVVKGFKTGCSRAWWRLQDEGEDEPGVFEGKNLRT